ncbi:dynein intermediate chain 2, ciliary-like [Scylla paramamosain]|uniref:dynein intermediate chain 2, ciliary-like n=1 Tax=Scylla paramamosain TaxID=85552 RepID=UPI00308377E6
MTFSRSKLKRRDTLEQQEEEEEEDEEERRRREEEEEKAREPQVEIRLSSTTAQPEGEVLYDFSTGYFHLVHHGDPLIHLFSAPSRIMPREEFELIYLQKTQEEEEEDEEAIARRKKEEEEKQKQKYLELQREFKAKKKKKKKKSAAKSQEAEEQEEQEEEEEEQYDIAKDIEDLYGNVMSPEQLAKLDSQPNPFNFSDRVTQTFRAPKKELSQQTDQPPSTTFGATAGLATLCDAYDRDYELKQEAERRKKEKEAEEAAKEEGKETTKTPLDPVVLLTPPSPPGKGGWHTWPALPRSWKEPYNRMYMQK